MRSWRRKWRNWRGAWGRRPRQRRIRRCRPREGRRGTSRGGGGGASARGVQARDASWTPTRMRGTRHGPRAARTARRSWAGRSRGRRRSMIGSNCGRCGRMARGSRCRVASVRVAVGGSRRKRRRGWSRARRSERRSRRWRCTSITRKRSVTSGCGRCLPTCSGWRSARERWRTCSGGCKGGSGSRRRRSASGCGGAGWCARTRHRRG